MAGKWQYFLTSLATSGGNLFLLVSFVILLLALVLHVLHDSTSNGQVTTVILSTFSAFSGALLQALRGRSGDTNPIPGGTTTTAVTTTSTIPKVE